MLRRRKVRSNKGKNGCPYKSRTAKTKRKVSSNKHKNGCPYKSRTAKTKRKVSSNKGIKGDTYESKTSKTRTRKRFKGGSNLPLENKCTPTESHIPNVRIENEIVCEQDVKQISASACVEGL